MTHIHIQIATEDVIPSETDFRKWVSAAMGDLTQQVSVRIMDSSEAQDLNRRFRHVDRATNVLAFPANESEFLGDIAICSQVTTAEARARKISLNDHFAHLVIHGVLHLRGFDHMKPEEAKLMQDMEVEMLEALGIQNPYR